MNAERTVVELHNVLPALSDDLVKAIYHELKAKRAMLLATYPKNVVDSMCFYVVDEAYSQVRAYLDNY